MDVADGLEALGECVEAELWESVEVLAAMLAARLETMANTHGSLLSVLYDRADALVELRRDREAVVAYDTLLERLDQSRTRVKLRNRRATRRDICAKLAKCHLRLGDHAAGIAVIEAVPEADRTLAMRMALGRALTAVHREQAASACFSAVIEVRCPLCLWSLLTGPYSLCRPPYRQQVSLLCCSTTPTSQALASHPQKSN